MPRKMKVQKKQLTVVLAGTPVAVTLHPPQGTRRSWYAYWNGLVASKSTGRHEFDAAAAAAEAMLKAWKQGGDGHRPLPTDGVMTDEEFEAIQRTHFQRKTDAVAVVRAGKTLTVCLEAVRAFRDISGLRPVTQATPDDCARFQRAALSRPKNWRQQHPRGRKPEEAERLSPNTVLKWSRALAAAFERANRNAGKKCIRGVVDERTLLTTNPWNQFDWIEGRSRPIRQLDAGEINALFDHLESGWAGVTVAPLLVKVFLWSACRQLEVAGLRWSSLRRNGDEAHFEVVGKWGVEKWFRVPPALLRELERVRADGPFVFAGYNEQLRRFHEAAGRPDNARRVGGEFKPMCLGDWFADRMDDWSATLAGGHAHTHVLRKTTLQYARIGEDINRQLAADARVSESVLMSSYVRETDEQLRQSSNRTYRRIVASFPAELAGRLGYAVDPGADLEERLKAAVGRKDWPLVAELTRLLSGGASGVLCG